MACHASGLHDECRITLERVSAAMPEDVDALKLLAHLYAENGDDRSAVKAYRTLLEFKPEDHEGKAQLEALLAGGESVSRSYADDDLESTDFKAPVASDEEDDDGSDDEEIHELNESDIVYDDEEAPQAVCTGEKSPVSDQHDPLSTVTLAELYVQQGFVAKALDIYRSILADDPSNELIRAKIAQLEEPEAAETEVPDQYQEPESEECGYEEEPEQESPAVAILEEVSSQFDSPAQGTEVDTAPIFVEEPVPFEEKAESVKPFAVVDETMSTPVEAAPFAPLQNQSADNVVNTLDSWLENIRRIKACR
jgi:tetratricopeptide (TPR) repeat protein